MQCPLWKEFLLLLILAAVVWALYRVGRELFFAGSAILAAFADLLGVRVRTLPHVMLAGVIALDGVRIINHLDSSLLRMPSWLQASDQSSSSDSRQAPLLRMSKTVRGRIASNRQLSTATPKSAPQQSRRFFGSVDTFVLNEPSGRYVQCKKLSTASGFGKKASDRFVLGAKNGCPPQFKLSYDQRLFS